MPTITIYLLDVTAIEAHSHLLQVHYDEFLRVIGEIGRDVKPAYTSNKISTDKLRKSMYLIRGLIRDCQVVFFV